MNWWHSSSPTDSFPPSSICWLKQSLCSERRPDLDLLSLGSNFTDYHWHWVYIYQVTTWPFVCTVCCCCQESSYLSSVMILTFFARWPFWLPNTGQQSTVRCLFPLYSLLTNQRNCRPLLMGVPCVLKGVGRGRQDMRLDTDQGIQCA